MNSRRLIGGLLLAGMIAMVLLLAWGHRGRVAEDRVREASLLLEQSRAIAALGAIDAVLADRPDFLPAIRLRVDILGALGRPEELEAARELWEETGVGDALIRLVRAAMKWDSKAIAYQALATTEARQALSPVDRLALEATVNARWGDYAAAARAFDKAIALGYPENDQSRLTMGILEIQKGDIEAGLRSLESVVPESPYYAEALRGMMRVYRESGRIENIKRHAEAFLTAPEIIISEKLATLDFLHGQGATASVKAALDWIWHSAPTGEAVADLLIWCYLDDRAVEWADNALASLPEEAFEVLPLRLVAVARERQYSAESRGEENPADKVGGAVSSVSALSAFATAISAPLRQPFSLSDFQNSSPYAALLSLERLHDEGLGSGSLRQRLAARQLHEQLMAASETIDGLDRFVRAFDLQSVWEPALVSLAKEQPRVAHPAVRLLYRIYSERKDAPALFRLMERALELDPDDLIALNNYTHLGLLLEIDPPRFQKLAERVGEHRARDVRFAGTYAFALLLKDRPEMALDVLEAYPSEALRTPSVAPYYAATLAAMGDTEGAADVLATIDPAMLFESEREFVEHLRSVPLVDERPAS